MNIDVYPVVAVNDDYSLVEFVSVGKYGTILKRITFMPTHWPNVYNLAFGDVTETGEIDDYKISDNGDRNKVLATIIKAVDDYTEMYPERWIYFVGSTDDRTRLYRIAVSLNFEELSATFDIYVRIEGREEFVLFEKGLKIKAFLVKRNSLNLNYEKEGN